MEKLIRFFYGLLLIPMTLASLYHLPSLFTSLSSRLESLLLILGGVLGYVVFEVLFTRPMRIYVFGHELTHALSCLAMGGSVKSFKVTENGGSVSVSKTNFLVSLSPYCIPIYSLFVLILYFAAGTFIPMEKFQWIFYLLLGFSLAFHVSLTFYAIRQKQPDIHKTGVLFSMVFILLVNAWFIVLLAKLLFRDSVSLKFFTIATFKTQWMIWKWMLLKTWDGLLWLKDHAQSSGSGTVHGTAPKS